MRFQAICNRDGGTFKTTDLDAFCERIGEAFRANGHEISCRVVSGDDLQAAIADAADDDTIDAMIVGGGDGTISSAAAEAFRTGKPLGVLPAGTMNLFARSLGVPLELDAAVAALASGVVGTADIATANGRPFVHQFSVGIHTRLVAIREGITYRSRVGKMVASIKAMIQAVGRPPNFSVQVRTDRGLQVRRSSGISVTNNPLAEGHAPYAEGLDHGVLGVYIARPMGGSQMLRLAAGVMIGRWKANALISEQSVRSLTLDFPRIRPSDQALMDGELMRLERTVHLEIHPGALNVILPHLTQAEEAA
ncbi:Diacylglycerol kinase family enzyme [Devosia enhydra]|uniref:Diacylglycerol kinase family enzyme n=1 Tax=Devosia enhydra TaxID=665118 RepID=A0A1K2HWB9_9HYPH|nr:diacylglycerol kinase family protein [Devosia enhydra]SFZ83252.1 Diacylglycerol kinase family enzyme [Devosia enhydra]